MTLLESKRLRDVAPEIAPDGSRVYPLLRLAAGGMAQFELDVGQVTQPIAHRRVAEIWLVVSGRGELWRRAGAHETTDVLEEGVCVSIPAGTAFQFRCSGDEPLRITAVTMPPWPGDDEAVPALGKWPRSG